MKINGTWKSSAGSTLKIEETNGKLSGTFQLKSDKTGTGHSVNGSIDPDSSPEIRPLSFSVAWTDEEGKSVHSVTAYSGQLSTKGEKNNIEVIFLMVNDKSPLWRGTGISYENFEQVD